MEGIGRVTYQDKSALSVTKVLQLHLANVCHETQNINIQWNEENNMVFLALPASYRKHFSFFQNPGIYQSLTHR